MNTFIEIFNIHIQQTQALLQKATKQKNPGMWLYKNNLRTPLFMLEAYFRIVEDIYNTKTFTKCKEQCKALEDALGALDYYVVYAATCKQLGKKCAPYIAVLNTKANEKNEALNKLLQEKGWLSGKKITKITNRVQKNKWSSIEKDMEALKKCYTASIKKIKAFYESKKEGFTDIELDVHELRRKLRWLSIYPQALQGIIQYKPTQTKPNKTIQKYATPDIIKSPFNKLPTAITIENSMQVHKHHYYALSWLIATLGTLKDQGLQIEVLHEAIHSKSPTLTTADIDKTIQSILGNKYNSKQQLLQEAFSVTKPFFTEKHLDLLVL
jgi:hypothetical protein